MGQISRIAELFEVRERGSSTFHFFIASASVETFPWLLHLGCNTRKSLPAAESYKQEIERK